MNTVFMTILCSLIRQHSFHIDSVLDYNSWVSVLGYFPSLCSKWKLSQSSRLTRVVSDLTYTNVNLCNCWHTTAVWISVWPTLALSSCSCAWRSASRRYASRSSSADRSESDGLLVYESADPCWWRGIWMDCYYLSIILNTWIDNFITWCIDLLFLFILLLSSVGSAVWLYAGVHANTYLHSWTHSCVSVHLQHNALLSHTSHLLVDQI